MKNSSTTDHYTVNMKPLQNASFLQGSLFRLSLHLLGRLVQDATVTIRCQDQESDFEICKGDGARYRMGLNHHSVLWSVLRHPDPGLGEAFMDRRWWLESGDLGSFLTMLAAGRQRFFDSIPGRLYKLISHFERKSSSHDIVSSYGDVQSHYDLGNDLYEGFLDRDMNYSCAFFESGDDSLAEAQQNKLQTTLGRLDVEPGMRVLDIGCGWGATCRFIAGQTDSRVTGITLARKQIELAEERSRKLPNAPRFLLQDYREHAEDYSGQYDRAVSIGMLEHVGRENLPVYFDCVSRLLAAEGRAVVHAIVAPPLETSKQLGSPWLTRYIFPGGYIPDLREIMTAARSARLELVGEPHIHGSFHYAETLRRWRRNFLGAYESLDQQHYDPRFKRMWLFYLCMCEAMFAGHGCRVAQVVLRKPGAG